MASGRWRWRSGRRSGSGQGTTHDENGPYWSPRGSLARREGYQPAGGKRVFQDRPVTRVSWWLAGLRRLAPGAEKVAVEPSRVALEHSLADRDGPLLVDDAIAH